MGPVRWRWWGGGCSSGRKRKREEVALGRRRFVSTDIVVINHETGGKDNLGDTIS